MRHGMGLAQTTRHSTSERRALVMFKSDHPRSIDRFIDYFGSEGSADGRAPSTDQSMGAQQRTA